MPVKPGQSRAPGAVPLSSCPPARSASAGGAPTPPKDSGNRGAGARDGHINPTNASAPNATGYSPPIDRLARYLGEYVVVERPWLSVLAAWTFASWIAKKWDRFPHLVITSREVRCGKRTLLHLLEPVVRYAARPSFDTHGFIQFVAKWGPTLLVSEGRLQKMPEMVRALLEAGIDKEAVAYCWRASDEARAYCPKAFVVTGEPEGELETHGLPVQMFRRPAGQHGKRFLPGEAKPKGTAMRSVMAKWAKCFGDRAGEAYAALEPLDIDNGRLADMLRPLVAVLHVMRDTQALADVKAYAAELERAAEERAVPMAIRLLTACRALFPKSGPTFLTTELLIERLCAMEGEPWATYKNGNPITPKALSVLFNEVEVSPGRSNDRKQRRGYDRTKLEPAWEKHRIPPQVEANAARS